MKVFPFAATILRSFDWSFYCSEISLFTEFPFCDQSLREMENFRGIAEESIPSFLTNSLLGNSEILENVTLSSNLGLPVAVSTLARNRSGTDNRYPDTEASYLVEGRFSVPSESSPSSQSEAEPREKLHLSFQDDEFYFIRAKTGAGEGQRDKKQMPCSAPGLKWVHDPMNFMLPLKDVHEHAYFLEPSLAFGGIFIPCF